MAAVTLALDTVKVVTLSATPNTLQAVNLPLGCLTVLVGARAANALVATTGADAAAIGSDYLTVASGVLAPIPCPMAGVVAARVIYIASPGVSTVIELLAVGGR